MSGSVTISSGTITSAQGTKVIGPLTVAAVNSVAAITDLQFASATFIAVTPPAFATGVVITPPSNNLIQLTLKGVTGDTGIPLSSNAPSLIPFFNTTAPAAFGLASAAAISGNVELSYF